MTYRQVTHPVLTRAAQRFFLGCEASVRLGVGSTLSARLKDSESSRSFLTTDLRSVSRGARGARVTVVVVDAPFTLLPGERPFVEGGDAEELAERALP